MGKFKKVSLCGEVVGGSGPSGGLICVRFCSFSSSSFRFFALRSQSRYPSPFPPDHDACRRSVGVLLGLCRAVHRRPRPQALCCASHRLELLLIRIYIRGMESGKKNRVGTRSIPLVEN